MDNTFKQNLKSKAHHLKPVVLIGAKGLTPAVVEETDAALTAHELIKIKISGLERAERLQIAHTICSELTAELVQCIGHTVIIYRQSLET